MLREQIMINLKKHQFFLLLALTSIYLQSFAGNVNQGMSNNSDNSNVESLAQSYQDSKKKAKIRSEFKRRYKPKTEEEIENQEEIVDISKLNDQPLTVLCMNGLANSTLIDKETESFIEAHHLLPLLRTVRGIKKAGYRNKELVQRLIRLTIDSDYRPDLLVLRKDLIEASFLGDVHAVSLLIEKGAAAQQVYKKLKDIPAQPRSINIYHNDKHYTLHNVSLERALIKATQENHLEIAKVLLNKIESDLIDEEKDNILNSGLPCAKSKEMVSLYLEKKAYIDSVQGPRETSCLGNAVIDGNIELIDFLLEHGAYPLAYDFDSDLTVVSHALNKMKKGDPLAKDLLVKFAHYSSTGSTNILLPIITDSETPENIKLEALRIVLEANIIYIDALDDRGWTALMYAVDRLSYRSVEILLNYGADTSLTNEKSQTALDMAKEKLNPLPPILSPGWYYKEMEEPLKIESQKIINLLENSAN